MLLQQKHSNSQTICYYCLPCKKGEKEEDCKIATRLLAPIPIRPPQPIPAILTCLPTTGLGQSNMPVFRWDSHLLKNTTQQIFSYANSSRLYPC